jgi:hypothetical protein
MASWWLGENWGAPGVWEEEVVGVVDEVEWDGGEWGVGKEEGEDGRRKEGSGERRGRRTSEEVVRRIWIRAEGTCLGTVLVW